MRRLQKVSLVMIALAIPMAASSQTMGQLVYRGHSGVVSGGVYVGPYTGSWTYPGATFQIFCVDDLHHPAAKNTPWDVWKSPLDGDLSYTYQAGAADTQDRYLKAAWLAMQFGANPTSAWGGIHNAIWDIVVDGATSGGSAGWIKDAEDNFASVDPRYWQVLSSPSTQEFLPLEQEFLVHVTPEPAGLLLLFTGLAGIAGVAYRRREDGDVV